MSNLPGGVVSAIGDMIKFCFVFYIFGEIALILLLGSLGVMAYLESGSFSAFAELFRDVKDAEAVLDYFLGGIEASIPFKKFFDLSIGSEGSLWIRLTDFFKNLPNIDYEGIRGAYEPFFLRDAAAMTIVSFLLFLCSRLNFLFTSMKSLISKVAYVLSMVWWFLSCCCIGECLLRIIEGWVNAEELENLYRMLIPGLLFVHAFLVGFAVEKKKKKTLRVLFYIAVKTAFDGITALLLWVACNCLFGMYALYSFDASILSSMFAFFLVAFLLRIVESLKEAVIQNKLYFTPQKETASVAT
ncbi:MAG: hypothetical protein ACI4U2_01090 [Christensenellaceae bacterium]